MIDSLLQAVAPLFVPLATLGGSPITPAELLGVALSLAMVVANMRVHPVAWPLAITSSALYALLFLEVKLYGEAGLQLFFIAMAAWGCCSGPPIPTPPGWTRCPPWAASPAPGCWAASCSRTGPPGSRSTWCRSHCSRSRACG